MRLTKKDYKPRVSNHKCYDAKEMAKKLGPLEDIEEELGIDLITLFKAFKQSIFVKIWKPDTNTTEIHVCHVFFSYPLLMIHDAFGVSVKDYGKTWAFSRSELE